MGHQLFDTSYGMFHEQNLDIAKLNPINEHAMRVNRIYKMRFQLRDEVFFTNKERLVGGEKVGRCQQKTKSPTSQQDEGLKSSLKVQNHADDAYAWRESESFAKSNAKWSASQKGGLSVGHNKIVIVHALTVTNNWQT